MINDKRKKIFRITMGVFVFLSIVLAIHIYIVTRPKALDPQALIMARIDIKDSIDTDDVNKITSWLYRQKGIDHVLVNPKTRIVVFTFFPVETTGDQIVKNFQTAFNYQATRYLPTEQEIDNGCPVIGNPVGNKVYTYIKHIF